MHDDISIFHRRGTSARQLVLLFHGADATSSALHAVGSAVARRFEQAWVLSAPAPDAPDGGGAARQPFSVGDGDDVYRAARVAQAMPAFARIVRHWQREAGVGAAATTLIGFSQGAVIVLESTQRAERLAGRVVAIAGRFAKVPRLAPIGTTLHLMHGLGDRVMPSRLGVDAVERLHALGASVTLDLFPSLAHEIDERVLERVVLRLQGPAAIVP
ncbi:MAG TPA: esterase [Burkholderiaceae bacterium]|nr:esterase [Burkholderiaceae bacterium]